MICAPGVLLEYWRVRCEGFDEDGGNLEIGVSKRVERTMDKQKEESAGPRTMTELGVEAKVSGGRGASPRAARKAASDADGANGSRHKTRESASLRKEAEPPSSSQCAEVGASSQAWYSDARAEVRPPRSPIQSV
jgi:hypothetical protein